MKLIGNHLYEERLSRNQRRFDDFSPHEMVLIEHIWKREKKIKDIKEKNM